MHIIEARSLKKVFKDITAVDGIDIHVKKGEILGILGPNGAGKSTSISMMATLITPSEGDIMLEGRSVLKEPKLIRHILGFVPQDVALYPDLVGPGKSGVFRQGLRPFG